MSVDIPEFNRLRGADDDDVIAAKRAFLGLARVRKGDFGMERGAAEGFPLHERGVDSLPGHRLRALGQTQPAGWIPLRIKDEASEPATSRKMFVSSM